MESVFLKNGMLLLVNRKMDILCEKLFGTGIMNSKQLLDDIKTKQLKNNTELICTEPNVTVKTSDGEIWNFRQREIIVDGSEIIELIAYNITKQYNLNLELKENNSRMDIICKRLGEFSENVTQLTHEKEILNAIISVHNNLGKALLMFRSYLAKPNNQKIEISFFSYGVLIWQCLILKYLQRIQKKLEITPTIYS